MQLTLHRYFAVTSYISYVTVVCLIALIANDFMKPKLIGRIGVMGELEYLYARSSK